MRFDTAIPLSRHLNEDGTPDAWTEARLRRAIARYDEGDSQSLLLSGGLVQPALGITHAMSMEWYARARGVEPEHMLLEQRGLDTVGQLVFSRMLMDAHGMDAALIVTSDVHLIRVPRLAKCIFPAEYAILFEGVPGADDYDPRIVAHERKGIHDFTTRFDGVEPGNIGQIVDRLFSAHPLYKGQDPQRAIYSR